MKKTPNHITEILHRFGHGLRVRVDAVHQGLFGKSLLVMAALMFTGMFLVIKLTANDLGPWEVGFARFLFGLIATLTAARAWKRGILGQHRPLLVLRGLAGTISFVCVVSAIQMIPLSQATVLFFMFPMFSAAFGIWINHDDISLVDWLFIVLGVCGALMILWPGTHSPDLQWGHLIALCSSMSAGFAIVMVRKLRAANHPFTLYFYFCLIGTPVCLAAILGDSQWRMPGLVPMAALLLTALLGLVGQLMMNEGVKDVPAHTGGILLSTQVIFAAAAGVLFLGEPMTWRLIFGSFLILGSGALLGLPKK